MKKLLTAILSVSLALGLSSCAIMGPKTHTVDCVPQCRLEIPEEINNGLVSYEEFISAVGAENYSNVEAMAGIKMDYRNIYSVTAYDGGLTISVYDLKSSIDPNTITSSNISDMVIDLLGETTIMLENGEYWGVDTSLEFYTNLEYDMTDSVVEETDDYQRLQVPLSSFSTYENYENETDDGFKEEKLEYEGYVVFLTPKDGSTKMFLAATYKDNELIDIEKIADSFVYDASVQGTDVVFDQEAIEKINQAISDVAPTDFE